MDCALLSLHAGVDPDTPDMTMTPLAKLELFISSQHPGHAAKVRSVAPAVESRPSFAGETFRTEQLASKNPPQLGVTPKIGLN